MVVMICLSAAMFMDDELRRRDAGPQDTLGVDVIAGHREAAERPLELIERQTGVKERAERHVARDAGETVEVQNPGHF